MKKTGFFVAVCLAGSIWADYAGRVFVDANRNGAFDSGEKPLAQVMVSDGLNVVRTDADGRFSLPGHAKARFVFVTTPSGYRAVGNYYRRVGDGAVYDFGLHPWDRIQPDGVHSFIQISDTEIRGMEPAHKVWADQVRDYARNTGAAFIMHTGDICYEGGLKAHIQLMNSDNMGCPMYYGIGNHDLVKGAYGEALFESLYGPCWYSFEVGNVHYIMTPMRSGDYRPSYTVGDVAAWLKNLLVLLPENKPLIVFNHDLISTNEAFNYGGIPLHAYNLKAWLYGHWHINFMRRQGETLTVSTATLDKGGIDHSTSAFRELQIDESGNLSSGMRYSYIDQTLTIPSIIDGKMPFAADGRTVSLAVTLYRSAAPVKRVIYTLSAGGQTLMREMPLALLTDWCWGAVIDLPAALRGRPLDITVAAEFADGTVVKREETFTAVRSPDVKPGADWPNLLGDAAHSGKNAGTVKSPLQLAWVQNVGGNIFMASPVLKDGLLFVATADEDLKGKGGIIALDVKTGKGKWRFMTRNSVKNSIAADQGLVFAQDAEGWLYAVETATGKLRWEKKLAVAGLPALVEGLTAENGIVYAGTGKGLSAWKAESGEQIWVNSGWAQHEGTPSTIAVGGGVVIQGAQWKGLYGNDAATGKQLWSISNPQMRFRASSAFIDGETAYIISQNTFYALEAKTGKILRQKEFKESLDVASTPLVTERFFIFGTVGDGLMALNRETLEVVWKTPVGQALIFTPSYSKPPASVIETSPVKVGETVFFGASDGILHGVDVQTGTCIWQHKTGAPILATPAVSGNTLFAVDFSGCVYALTSAE